MDDIEEILMKIEDELQNGKKALFGSGVTVDREIIFSLLERLRNALPDVIREAKVIVHNAEKRRQEEIEKAQKMFQVAERRAEELLSNHTIIEQAEREAEAIRSQANEYSGRIIQDVRKDIDILLKDAEEKLSESIAVIQGAIASNLRK